MKLLRGILWVLTALLTALEVCLAWLWLKLTLYVMEYGRAENPYAAEDAEITGIIAALLLPLTLAALIWAVRRIMLRYKSCERRDRGEEYADDLL